MSNIDCKHPSLIYNPNLSKLIMMGYSRVITPSYSFVIDKKKREAAYHNVSIWFDGINIKEGYVHMETGKFLYYGEYKKLSPEEKHYYVPKYKGSVSSILDGFKITNGIVEEPLFIAVPCGTKCSVCRKKKVDEWSNRVAFHAAHSTVPYFITLTTNSHFEKEYGRRPDKKTQVEIIQKFMKKLRIMLQRAGYKTDFKYFLVSEFGKQSTKRLHFHAVFLDVDPSLDRVMPNIYEDSLVFKYIYILNHYIRKAWTSPYDGVSYGFVSCYKARDEKGSYVMKYMAKQRDNICLRSMRIGYDALERYRENIVNSPTEQLVQYEGRLKGSIALSKWMLKKVLPNYVESLDVEFRNALHSCYATAITLRHYNYLVSIGKCPFHLNFRIYSDILSNLDYLQSFIDKYGELLSAIHGEEDVFEDAFFSRTMRSSKDIKETFDEFMASYKVLESYDYDLHKVVYLHGQRNKRVIYTNFVMKDVDVTLKAYKADKFFEMLEQKAVL